MSAENEVDSAVKAPDNKRWLLTSILFFIGWVFMYADRTILSPIQGEIMTEFGLSNAQIGLISSLFFLVYTATQIPSGILGDRYGRTKVIFFGFMIFGLTTGLTGLVQSFGILLLVRAVAGFGEGFYYGPQYAISADSTPLKYRTLAYAIVNSGQAFGITLGLVGSGYLSYELGWGWRSTFLIYAIPTLVAGFLILWFVRDGINAPKRDTPRNAGKDLREIFKNKCLMSVFFIEFCSVYGFFVMVTWLPMYLSEARGIPMSEAGAMSSLVAWTSVPAALLIGRVSDRLKTRKPILLGLLLLAMSSIYLLIQAQSWTLTVVALVFYGVVGKLTTDPIILALISDNAPKDNLSTVYGVYNCIAMLGAILAPYFTGWLKDVTTSFQSGFYCSIGILIIAWIVAAFLMHPKPVAD